MYKFSRVSNFANLALRTYLHVLLLTYLQRGHSVESAEQRIFKIGQLGAEKYAFKIGKLCSLRTKG